MEEFDKERRKFIKNLAVTAASTSMISGCWSKVGVGEKSEKKLLKSGKLEDNLDFKDLETLNDWDYPVKINSLQLVKVANKLGLPINTNRPTKIITSGEINIFATHFRNPQFHKVELGGEDVISVSCGFFVDFIKEKTHGKDPYTRTHELFLTSVVSESIFDGFIDIARMRDDIPIESARILDYRYQEMVSGLLKTDPSLLFAKVDLNTESLMA